MPRPGFVTPEPTPPRTDPLLILRSLAVQRHHAILPESEARILARYVYRLLRKAVQRTKERRALRQKVAHLEDRVRTLQAENASLREMAIESTRAGEGR